MSTAHLPQKQWQPRQDASKGTGIISPRPLLQPEGIPYLPTSSLPESSQTPSYFLPDVAFPTSPSLTSGLYSDGGDDFYSGYLLSYDSMYSAFDPSSPGVGSQAPSYPHDGMPVGTDSNTPGLTSSEGLAHYEQTLTQPASSAPETFIEDQVALDFQTPSHPCDNMPVGTASSTPGVSPSDGLGHYEQTTFQFASSAQEASVEDQRVHFMAPEAPPVQDQGQAQCDVQDAQQDFSTPQGLEGHDRQVDDTSNGSSGVVLEDHTCHKNPDSVCPGSCGGNICIDQLYGHIEEYPNDFTSEQVARLFQKILSNAAIARWSAVGRNDHRLAAAPSASSSRTSSPPSTLTVSPPTNSASVAESSSTSTLVLSTRKRKRSEDHPEDLPTKRQRKQPMNAFNAGDSNEQTDNSHPKRQKKDVDGCHICMICLMLKEPMSQKIILSRRDALKRHIELKHPLFEELLEIQHREFRILERRKADEFEVDYELVKACIKMQIEARQRGEQTRETRDLTRLYPEIAKSMNLA